MRVGAVSRYLLLGDTETLSVRLQCCCSGAQPDIWGAQIGTWVPCWLVCDAGGRARASGTHTLTLDRCVNVICICVFRNCVCVHARVFMGEGSYGTAWRVAVREQLRLSVLVFPPCLTRDLFTALSQTSWPIYTAVPGL